MSFAPSLRNRSFDANDPEPVELSLSRRTSFKLASASMLGLGDESAFAFGESGGDDTEFRGRKFVGRFGFCEADIVIVFRDGADGVSQRFTQRSTR